MLYTYIYSALGDIYSPSILSSVMHPSIGTPFNITRSRGRPRGRGRGRGSSVKMLGLNGKLFLLAWLP